MNIKYEKNSRVNKALKAGRLTPDDVIKKCSTSQFPAETATVRLHRIQSQNPWAVIHIRGEGENRTYNMWSGGTQTYVHSPTLRVHIDTENDSLEFSGNCPIKSLDVLQKIVDEVRRKLSL